MAVIVIRTGDERVESVFAPVSRFVGPAWVREKNVGVTVIVTLLFRSFYYNFFAFTNFTRSALLVSIINIYRPIIFINLRKSKMKQFTVVKYFLLRNAIYKISVICSYRCSSCNLQDNDTRDRNKKYRLADLIRVISIDESVKI